MAAAALQLSSPDIWDRQLVRREKAAKRKHGFVVEPEELTLDKCVVGQFEF